MAIGGVVELVFGVSAEGKNLEDIAQPLTAGDSGSEAGGSRDDDRNDAAASVDDSDHARVEERIRERRRRRAASASGIRRYRPGPGRELYSPRMLVSSAGAQDETLDREISTIARIAQDRGSLTPRELADAAGAQFWGPGRFRAALHEALVEGRVVRLAAGRLGPPTRKSTR